MGYVSNLNLVIYLSVKIALYCFSICFVIVSRSVSFFVIEAKGCCNEFRYQLIL